MNIQTIFESFKAEWLGRRIDWDHVFNYQCVDLILEYIYEKFGLSHTRGNAIDYWTNPSPDILTKFHKVASSDPQIGDIVVMLGLPGNPYGHIGIATGNKTATTVEILEQNGATGNGSGMGGDAIRTRFIAKNRIAGLLRANGADITQATGRLLNLPASVTSWRVYKVAGPWTVGNEIAKLSPAQYGGLSYEIVGNPATNIYLINSQMFGQVAIYAGPDTPATFSDRPISIPEPAPSPAPEPPKPVNIVYTKFEKPLELITKRQPTRLWDLGFADDVHVTILEELPQGLGFIAFGQAQRTDNDKPCYYMTEADFGSADTTGQPNRNGGVNTVDLAPALPKATEAVTVSSALPDNTVFTITPSNDSGTVVKTITISPPTDDFRDTFKETKATYKALKNIKVTDLYADNPEQDLGHDVIVHAGGEFSKDGQAYIRTEKSIVSGKWYGIPKSDLVPVANPSNYVGKLMDVKPPIVKEFEEIEAIAEEIQATPEFKEFHKQFDKREQMAARIGHAEDKLSGFVRKLKIKRSK